MDHMELLIHFSRDRSMFSLAIGSGEDNSSMSLALDLALKTPYVLHQMLAYAARHLAYLKPPEEVQKYHRLAVSLQTRAVTLFNAVGREVDENNCVAVLIFSAVLGHHLLADTLTHRGPGGLVSFLASLAHCLDIQRGIYVIFGTARPFLMNSILEEVLSLSVAFTSREAIGPDCDNLRKLLESSTRLDTQEREACMLAVHYLQLGFDALNEDLGLHPRYRHRMCFSWMMMVPPGFTALLAAGRPDALVVLAYYALLLHFGRENWQVRDAGTFIMDLITDHLGAEWEAWLEYPRQRMVLT